MYKFAFPIWQMHSKSIKYFIKTWFEYSAIFKKHTKAVSIHLEKNKVIKLIRSRITCWMQSTPDIYTMEIILFDISFIISTLSASTMWTANVLCAILSLDAFFRFISNSCSLVSSFNDVSVVVMFAFCHRFRVCIALHCIAPTRIVYTRSECNYI